MNEELTLKKFDEFLKNNKIKEAKEFIEDELNKAIIKSDTSLIITILNEIIGFYRDLGLADDSYKFACSLEKLIGACDNKAKFISYINIGNSYRQSHHYDMAHNAFNNALGLYNEDFNLTIEYAALFNNLGLLYQEEEKYKEAIDSFNKALKMSNNSIKNATTFVNLTECYIGLNDLNLAFLYINKAKEIFEKNLDDFHIMGYYKTMAHLYLLKNEYELSEEYYLKALAKIDRFTGRGNLYFEIVSELDLVLKKLNKNRLSGLELSFNYYNDFKDILFKDIDKNTLNNITIGLFGLGSECYNADDYISEDHDFNPGFIVLVEDNISKSEFDKLKNNYQLLPKEYNRFYIRDILSNHGCHYVSDYLFEFLGIEDFNHLTMQNKSLLTNGKIFYLGENSTFYNLRKKTINKSLDDYLIDVSLKALEISQYPYNLKRSKDRGDINTYNILKNHLIDKIIEYYYVYNHKYLPHDKLVLKLMTDNNYKEIINNIINDNIEYDRINKLVINNLYDLFIIDNKKNNSIFDYKNEIVKYVKDYLFKQNIIPKIIDIEWEMFTSLNNIGGRAECQNNRPMFNLMRKAQYFAWDNELLSSYYNDLTKALNNNYNLLWIKYGFMEETIDKKHYNLIKNNLPALSKKMINLREAIVLVQLEMLDEYSKNNDISKMRTIYTSTDKYNNASYETYLRGELSSYSENTLYLYAKYITNLSKCNQNIVKLIMFYTNLFNNII